MVLNYVLKFKQKRELIVDGFWEFRANTLDEKCKKTEIKQGCIDRVLQKEHLVILHIISFLGKNTLHFIFHPCQSLELEIKA